MIHPHTELRYVNPKIGYGVFATAFIPKGTITWVLDPLDQQLEAHDVERLGPSYAKLIEKYSYVERSGRRILCWDFARFMNHSCAANSMSPGLDFEIALRDIPPGEELTSDYGALNLERAFNCFCGEPGCRGVVRPEDFEVWARRWDREVGEAFSRIPSVPQELWLYVRERREIALGLEAPARIPSILCNRFLVVGSTNGSAEHEAQHDVALEGAAP